MVNNEPDTLFRLLKVRRCSMSTGTACLISPAARAGNGGSHWIKHPHFRDEPRERVLGPADKEFVSDDGEWSLDVNGDAKVDILMGGKSGLYLFLKSGAPAAIPVGRPWNPR